ncbi:T9SS type A sorting domain-containing protein [Chryseobacterium balustinum]|nr:T9SS type A sorting domain-containing protein [Chryseobacterium balustinum]
MKDSLNKDSINIQDFTSGTYILELIFKDKIQSLKFIKK